jgi:RimJ/RimL family protein N-acetyltransferase
MRYKKFEGERLYFSPLDINDLQTFTKWINDETLSRGLGNYANNFSELAEKDFLEKACKDTNRYQFSVIRKDDDSIIGTYDLHNVYLIHGFAEVGGFIGDISDRNKGYGTEALRMICDYGFNVLRLNSLVGYVFSFNHASQKHLQKVGFKKVGEVAQRYFYNGKYHSEFIYQITRDEFYKIHNTFLKSLPECKN